MQIEETGLAGLHLVKPRRFGDARGFFAETYNARVFREAGIETRFVQDNHSVSDKPGTVRGLHFQAPPSAQAKLVRCGRGRIFDVAVDIRAGSPTHGQWYGVELSASNGLQMFVPKGFAHGFLTLEPGSEIIYKCSDFYAPATEAAILWNDPALGIGWPLGDFAPIISDKDAAATPWHDFETPFSAGQSA